MSQSEEAQRIGIQRSGREKTAPKGVEFPVISDILCMVKISFRIPSEL